VIGGVERKIHFFAMDLPHSDAGFVQAYPAETTGAFCAAHVAAFAFFGGVPASILYDNTKLAVARILKPWTTLTFSRWNSGITTSAAVGATGSPFAPAVIELAVAVVRHNHSAEILDVPLESHSRLKNSPD
jgi:hypothetical protein